MKSGTLDLIVRKEGQRLVLESPEPGLFTCALPRGCALAPGQTAGVLLQLGRATSLVVPAQAAGRVASAPPERVHQPVGAGTVLYELEALDAAGFETAEEHATEETGLVLRAEQSGRFYHRPSPGDAPFVEAGSALDEGTPVGLLEVMKTFTHVFYGTRGGLPARGCVVRMLVEDGADVEAGEALLEVESR